MRTAAGFDHVGVAHDDAHGLTRHAQQVGDDLCETGLMALPGRLRADDHIDKAVSPHGDASLLFGRADGGFDIIGEAASEQLAALGGFAFARGKAVPVGNAHGDVHRIFVAAAVVKHADRVAVWHRLWLDEVAPAYRNAIDSELGGRDVDKPLDGKRHLGASGAAIGLGRHRIGVDRHRA